MLELANFQSILTSFFPKSNKPGNFSRCYLRLLHCGYFYECVVDDIKHELDQRKAHDVTKLSCLLDFTAFLQPSREVFHQLFNLCGIAIALPVSSASCECNFSTLILIKKNHLGTTINCRQVQQHWPAEYREGHWTWMTLLNVLPKNTKQTYSYVIIFNIF